MSPPTTPTLTLKSLLLTTLLILSPITPSSSNSSPLGVAAHNTALSRRQNQSGMEKRVHRHRSGGGGGGEENFKLERKGRERGFEFRREGEEKRQEGGELGQILENILETLNSSTSTSPPSSSTDPLPESTSPLESTSVSLTTETASSTPVAESSVAESSAATTEAGSKTTAAATTETTGGESTIAPATSEGEGATSTSVLDAGWSPFHEDFAHYIEQIKGIAHEGHKVMPNLRIWRRQEGPVPSGVPGREDEQEQIESGELAEEQVGEEKEEEKQGETTVPLEAKTTPPLETTFAAETTSHASPTSVHEEETLPIPSASEHTSLQMSPSPIPEPAETSPPPESTSVTSSSVETSLSQSEIGVAEEKPSAEIPSATVSQGEATSEVEQHGSTVSPDPETTQMASSNSPAEPSAAGAGGASGASTTAATTAVFRPAVETSAREGDQTQIGAEAEPSGSGREVLPEGESEPTSIHSPLGHQITSDTSSAASAVTSQHVEVETRPNTSPSPTTTEEATLEAPPSALPSVAGEVAEGESITASAASTAQQHTSAQGAASGNGVTAQDTAIPSATPTSNPGNTDSLSRAGEADITGYSSPDSPQGSASVSVGESSQVQSANLEPTSLTASASASNANETPDTLPSPTISESLPSNSAVVDLPDVATAANASGHPLDTSYSNNAPDPSNTIAAGETIPPTASISFSPVGKAATSIASDSTAAASPTDLTSPGPTTLLPETTPVETASASANIDPAASSASEQESQASGSSVSDASPTVSPPETTAVTSAAGETSVSVTSVGEASSAVSPQDTLAPVSTASTDSGASGATTSPSPIQTDATQQSQVTEAASGSTVEASPTDTASASQATIAAPAEVTDAPSTPSTGASTAVVSDSASAQPSTAVEEGQSEASPTVAATSQAEASAITSDASAAGAEAATSEAEQSTAISDAGVSVTASTSMAQQSAAAPSAGSSGSSVTIVSPDQTELGSIIGASESMGFSSTATASDAVESSATTDGAPPAVVTKEATSIASQGSPTSVVESAASTFGPVPAESSAQTPEVTSIATDATSAVQSSVEGFTEGAASSVGTTDGTPSPTSEGVQTSAATDAAQSSTSVFESQASAQPSAMTSPADTTVTSENGATIGAGTSVATTEPSAQPSPTNPVGTNPVGETVASSGTAVFQSENGISTTTFAAEQSSSTSQVFGPIISPSTAAFESSVGEGISSATMQTGTMQTGTATSVISASQAAPSSAAESTAAQEQPQTTTATFTSVDPSGEPVTYVSTVTTSAGVSPSTGAEVPGTNATSVLGSQSAETTSAAESAAESAPTSGVETAAASTDAGSVTAAATDSWSESSSSADFQTYTPTQTSLIFAAPPSTTSAPGTTYVESQSFTAATDSLTLTPETTLVMPSTAIIATNVPTMIVPPSQPSTTATAAQATGTGSGGSGADDQALISILLNKENYPWGWVVNNSDATSQLFIEFPVMLSTALSLDNSQVQTYALQAYAPASYNGESTEMLTKWLGFIPTGKVNDLAQYIKAPNSPLYNQPGIPGQLAKQIDASYPLVGTSTGGDGSATSAASVSKDDSTRRDAIIGVTVGVGGAIWIALAFWIYRRVKRNHDRNIHKRLSGGFSTHANAPMAGEGLYGSRHSRSSSVAASDIDDRPSSFYANDEDNFPENRRRQSSMTQAVRQSVSWNGQITQNGESSPSAVSGIGSSWFRSSAGSHSMRFSRDYSGVQTSPQMTQNPFADIVHRSYLENGPSARNDSWRRSTNGRPVDKRTIGAPTLQSNSLEFTGYR